jgi:predicted nucleic acid-binding protein
VGFSADGTNSKGAGRGGDLMIAATALSLGALLVTRNADDVEGLTVSVLTR